MPIKLRIAIVVALLIALAGGIWWWTHDHAHEGPLVLYGNVDIREVEMAFRQPGRVASLAVDEGTTVEKGKLLAELDAKPYEDGVAMAEAAVAGARAEVAKLRRGSRTQEIAQSEDAVHQAEAAARQTATNFERQASLLATGGASQKTVDAARSARDQAAAALAAAKQGLSLRREGARREDITAAEARLDAAAAALAQAQTALADTRLTAPADAIVMTRVVEPGSMVNANTPVVILSLADPVYIRAYAGEADLPQVAPGTPVTVRADGVATEFHGTIGFVSPRAEFTPKSVETADLRTALVYRLRVVVPAANALRQGMPVTVTVHPQPSGERGK